jgi:hypothetical protein
MVYYAVTTAILAALLFVPTAKLIWVLSVRRLERRTRQPLSEAERRGQLRRARVIAAVVTVVFAALFNWQLLGIFERG